MFSAILAVAITCQIAVGMCAVAQEGENVTAHLLELVQANTPSDQIVSEQEKSPVDDIHDGELHLALPPREIIALDLLATLLILAVAHFVAIFPVQVCGLQAIFSVAPFGAAQVNDRPRYLVLQCIRA